MDRGLILICCHAPKKRIAISAAGPPMFRERKSVLGSSEYQSV